jgi:hypothetical protein
MGEKTSGPDWVLRCALMYGAALLHVQGWLIWHDAEMHRCMAIAVLQMGCAATALVRVAP